MLYQFRGEARQCRRSSLHVVDIDHAWIHIEFLAQRRNTVCQLRHKFNAAEACAADNKINMFLCIIFILVFGELILNMLTDQPHGINAADRQCVLVQSRNPEGFGFPAQGDYKIVIRQRAIFQNYLFLLCTNFLYGRFYEINFEFIN
ncbi:hypothetical protein D3C87_1694690 [compost metagenome]